MEMRVQAWVLLRHFVYWNEKVKLRLSPVDEDVLNTSSLPETMRKTQGNNEENMK